MLSKGNGNAEVTAQNLVKTVRGEIPFDRIRGIDISFTDRPAAEVKTDIINDVIETIEDYEPRVDIKNIDINQNGNGSFNINLEIDTIKEQEDEDEQFN